MVILRCFRLICVGGVVVSAISFALGTLAISTGSWLLSQGLVPPVRSAGDAATPGPVAVASAAPGNSSNSNSTATATATPTAPTEPSAETDRPTAAGSGRSTPGPTSADGGGNATGAGPELEMDAVIATSGLWQLCQANIESGIVVGAWSVLVHQTGAAYEYSNAQNGPTPVCPVFDWECSNIIHTLASMTNTKQLMVVTARSANLTSSYSSEPPSDLTVYIETSGVYFQSMLAFELISVAATLAGCCIATIAIYKEQPLAVLVAAFTMFFAGMFMLVGHLMMLSIHKAKNGQDTSENHWYYGWSFVVAWLSFCLCLVSGIINCVVYRNFRKMSEELTGTPSRVKYANRPPPVSLGSSI